MTLVVRASDAASATRLAPSIRQAIWSIDKDQPIGSVQTIPEIAVERTGGDQFAGEFLVAITGLALGLAAMGIYGVLANMMAERTHEIGLRMALGAQKSHVFRLVIGKGMLLTGIGVILGLLLSIPIPRHLLVGTTLSGNALFLIAPAVILAAALTACYIPARRAMRVDPMAALRHE